MGQQSKIYANILACYNEGKLLGGEKIRRLSEANFRDAVKMLADYGYGGGSLNEKSYDVDALITQETAGLISFVSDECANEYLKNCLLNEYLYSDAKVLYKSKFVDIDKKLSLYGVFDELEKAIQSKDYSELPVFLQNALLHLDSVGENAKPEPKEIDIVLTKAMHEDNLYNANGSRDKRLIKFVRTKIDFCNVTTAFRLKKLSYKLQAFDAEFISGGAISYEQLSKIFALDGEALALEFDGSEYDEVINKLIIADDFIDFERGAYEQLNSILASSSYDMQTLSPFINYFIAQTSEYKLIKTILVCLKNNARDELARRIRSDND